MISLFVLPVLLAAGLAIGHQDLSDASLPVIRDAHHSIGPGHITPRPFHSSTNMKRLATQLLKRDTCTDEPCLLPRKHTSPSPPPPLNRGGNRPDSPGHTRNGSTGNNAPQGNQATGLTRSPTPVPAPMHPPSTSRSLPILNTWRGNPEPLPLSASMPALLPERPLPITPPHPRQISWSAGNDMMRAPHDPVFFGTPSSSFRTWYSRGH